CSASAAGAPVGPCRWWSPRRWSMCSPASAMPCCRIWSRPERVGGDCSDDGGPAVAVGDDRQIRLQPQVHAAADVDRVEAVVVQPLGDLDAAPAGAADDVQILVVLGQLVE